MIWFTSDQHFWHRNVIKYCNRPFETVEEMNEKLVQYWNELVLPDDTVYVLGDFSMAFRPVEVYPKRMNGKKILIAGNHDFCHPAHKNSRHEENRNKWIGNYIANGFVEVYTQLELDIDGTKVLMCHLPYLEENSKQDQRYPTHRPIDNGLPLLCGHVHNTWKDRKTSKGTPMVNVGVDVWNFRPITFEEIKKLL
jgi:calcineurin-like phosphoesterase family protein